MTSSYPGGSAAEAGRAIANSSKKPKLKIARVATTSTCTDGEKRHMLSWVDTDVTLRAYLCFLRFVSGILWGLVSGEVKIRISEKDFTAEKVFLQFCVVGGTCLEK